MLFKKGYLPTNRFRFVIFPEVFEASVSALKHTPQTVQQSVVFRVEKGGASGLPSGLRLRRDGAGSGSDVERGALFTPDVSRRKWPKRSDPRGFSQVVLKESGRPFDDMSSVLIGKDHVVDPKQDLIRF